MSELFVPTVENPGRVSFSEDGTTWACTRDEFVRYSDGGELQMLITRFAPAGSPLPPQHRYVDKPYPLYPLKEEK